MQSSYYRSFASSVSLATLFALSGGAAAQEFSAGEPIGATNEQGERVAMSDNVKVYGSFHFSESCTFDPDRNLILAMNTGNRGDGTENDGFVSLINPDGSVHTPKWIGATRDGLELHHPLGSAIQGGVLSPDGEAEIIAEGIPSAASMCYDSEQNQLVIPLNSNFALAFVPL